MENPGRKISHFRPHNLRGPGSMGLIESDNFVCFAPMLDKKVYFATWSPGLTFNFFLLFQ